MQVTPFHSVSFVASKVHHNQSACADGDKIETRYMRSGTAGLPLCRACAEMAVAARKAGVAQSA
jgi:hypothetical protein